MVARQKHLSRGSLARPRVVTMRSDDEKPRMDVHFGEYGYKSSFDIPVAKWTGMALSKFGQRVLLPRSRNNFRRS